MHALEMVLGGERPNPDAALAALTQPYRWAPAGRPRTVRRTWLDTFDWRLHRAGLLLEQSSRGRGREIALAGPDGGRVAAPAGRVRWPALTDALSPGELRDRLGAVAGARALLPVARAVSSVRDLRVLNADGKTVVWLTVDETAVTGPVPATLPPRLVITAVRGYQADAERVAQALAGVPGARAAGGNVLEAALAPAGQSPGGYTGKVSVQLSPDRPARLAMAAVLVQLLDTLAANVDGAIRDVDSEFLHDLRVAVRRTRSALKLAGSALPPSLPRRYQPEFKWLGDLTTPTRDLDVFLASLPAMAAGLTAGTPAELEPLRAYLTGQRAAERRRLAAGLRSARFTGLMAGWRSALGCLTAPAGGPAVAGFAAARTARAYRTVLTLGGAITAGSPPEALHDLRKRCKELRYLLEFFASLHDEHTHQRVLKDLKGLQDCLGAFQDGRVQQEALRAFADRMKPGVPAATLLAMGEVAAQVAAGQQQARGELAGRFASFAAPAAQRRMRALLAAAAP
ncbi:MAG: CHAD domain-containing protein [Actinobacteria bacterium]|nr:CHAD domain-containing protein [Actinomycetota bacterium]